MTYAQELAMAIFFGLAVWGWCEARRQYLNGKKALRARMAQEEIASWPTSREWSAERDRAIAEAHALQLKAMLDEEHEQRVHWERLAEKRLVAIRSLRQQRDYLRSH